MIKVSVFYATMDITLLKIQTAVSVKKSMTCAKLTACPRENVPPATLDTSCRLKDNASDSFDRYFFTLSLFHSNLNLI